MKIGSIEERQMIKVFKSSEKKLAYYKAYIETPGGLAKHNARMETRRAIRRGELTRQPCEKCGGLKSEVHHEDYSNPMEVRWLCRPCHSLEHRKTHCRRGHELSGDNIRYLKGKRHSCRECRSIDARERYLAKKAIT